MGAVDLAGSHDSPRREFDSLFMCQEAAVATSDHQRGILAAPQDFERVQFPVGSRLGCHDGARPQVLRQLSGLAVAAQKGERVAFGNAQTVQQADDRIAPPHAVFTMEAGVRRFEQAYGRWRQPVEIRPDVDTSLLRGRCDSKRSDHAEPRHSTDDGCSPTMAHEPIDGGMRMR